MMATLKLNLIGKDLELTDALKSIIEEKFSRLEKYLGGGKEEVFADVIVSKEKYRASVEIVIYNIFDHTIRIKKETDDLYTSIDEVVDAAEKQLRRLKEKVQKSRRNNKEGVKEFSLIEEETVEKPIRIIEVEPELYKPITVEDAAVKLLSSNREFVVFCDASTKKAAVLYKRKDGNLGLIEIPSCT
ncbi:MULTISPECIES: ribosome hibernation-promoting factor, HPF/YfiA family [unclassified Desulfurobacterium]|uniref:ribosome hibernation-promoting factor, HPF/YfiA family n=1 Tax=Desulfurobacterium sp. TC5-1 TaxID=1158318 RepID=UPI0003B5D613|nr:ribosome-associated translation inhibitor RaiA [Desulfurobacterium sp. TC5-1]